MALPFVILQIVILPAMHGHPYRMPGWSIGPVLVGWWIAKLMKRAVWRAIQMVTQYCASIKAVVEQYDAAIQPLEPCDHLSYYCFQNSLTHTTVSKGQ